MKIFNLNFAFKMKHKFKGIVRNLPGPQSYCKCDKLCSKLEVEHVIPKEILKKHPQFNQSFIDLNNLYTCCKRMNRQKGTDLFGKHFMLDNEKSFHTGALARACLHMNEVYSLKIDKKIVAIWKELHQNHAPHDFEFERDEIIYEITQRGNIYLEDYFQDKDKFY